MSHREPYQSVVPSVDGHEIVPVLRRSFNQQLHHLFLEILAFQSHPHRQFYSLYYGCPLAIATSLWMSVLRYVCMYVSTMSGINEEGVVAVQGFVLKWANT